MHLKFMAAAGIAAFMLLTPARADASCCEKKDMPCCAQHKDMAQHNEMPCCGEKDKDAIEMLLALDPQINPAPPAKQLTDIWFMRPTWVGKSILQGHYVIEHDNDRMARGEPCTHIYAFDDRTTPVVKFHCTHLERARSKENIAVLGNKGDLKVLQEFQFGGETASHGVPDNIR